MNTLTLKALMLAMGMALLNINTFSQDFVYDWVRSAGGERWDLASDLVIDQDKNVYMTGGFEQTAFFGSDSLVSAGERDIFIAKYDSIGTLVWLKQAGGKLYDNVNDIEIDTEGNLLLAGNFKDTSYFDGQSIICNAYMNNFIAKYTDAGNLIQVKAINSETRAGNLMLTLTDGGDFLLSGTYYGTMNIDTDTLISDGKTDIFMAGFDSDLTYQTLLNIGGFANDNIKDLKYFNQHYYITCEFTDSIDINETRYYSYGSSDILLLKADKLGNILNVKHFAGFGTDRAGSIVFAADSTFYITGEFSKTIYFGQDSLISYGGKDVFLMKSDTVFNPLWTKQIGSATDEYANTLLINTVDAVYLTGSFSDSLSIENKSIISEQQTADMFIAKFTPQGDNIGLKQAGGSGNEYNNVLINDLDNYLYIIGNFTYDFAFETDSISSDSIFEANSDDVFIARFYDCDYARYPDIGQDTSFCGFGLLEVKNPQKQGRIFGEFRHYVWNNGQSGKQIVIYDSAYYSVTTIDSHKCSVTSDSIFVAVLPEAEPDLGENIYAVPEEIVELFGGNFESYLWSNDSITYSISINTTELSDYINNFTLTATNTYGCTGEDDINIYVEGASYGTGGSNQYLNQGGQTYDNNENTSNKSVRALGAVRRIADTDKEIIQLSALVYPNPNKGEFFINIDKLSEDIQNIKLYSEDGRKVYEQNTINSNQHKINIQSKGAHYLLIETDTKLFFEKIIIQ